MVRNSSRRGKGKAATPGRMIDFVKKYASFRLAPNSPDTDRFAKSVLDELPFRTFEFQSGTEVNGWVCPENWEPTVATINDAAGRLIYDGMLHPLGVVGYSRSFAGQINGSELKGHLFFPDAHEDALVYHCDLFYKPHLRVWGFSVTKKFFHSIRDEEKYRVELRTRFSSGTMKLLEYVLEGESNESIILNAHNCHAASSNDDLAGIAVGIEVMRRLKKRPKRRFTYRLIVAPEHFGSIFYLDSLTKKKAALLKCGLFLEMLGTKGPLNLQRSFLGDTLIDRALLNAMKSTAQGWRTDLFRKVVGNDETCWEAAGFEIPFPSLSRSEGMPPFPEYHSSKDTPEILSEEKMDEAATVIVRALAMLEDDVFMKRKFQGLVALSNPKYDLYKPFFDPSIPDRKTIDDTSLRWNYLMNCIPRYFDGKTRILDIAERHELPFHVVADYVEQFREKGLVDTSPAPLDSPSPVSLPPR